MLVSVVLIMCNGYNCLFAAKKKAEKRAGNFEYVVDTGNSWDDWGKDHAASNIQVGKRARKGVHRLE